MSTDTDTASARRFIVVFDDEQAACWPMSWDADCAGALCGFSGCGVALFTSRQAARKAIRISTAYAKLRKAQGKPANDDFLEGIACVKIIQCEEPPNV